MTVVAFVALAAIATLVRATVTSDQPRAAIPWNTLAINVFGAFLLGCITTAQFPHPSIVLTVAGLGSLTTFSTVVGETAGLIDDGHKRTAIAYVGLTLVAGIVAARIGLEIGVNL